MFKEDTLKGKSIIITGGGSGLGLAMAKGFASVGANIGICGRTESKLEKAAEAIRKVGNEAEVRIYSCDVRDYDQVAAMFEYFDAEFGSISGLVNNAAGNFLSASEDLTPGGFKAVVDIVLHGSFNCTHVFGNQLIKKEREGTILNIVTTYAEGTGSAFVLPSACSKAGVLAMTRSLAFEWAEYGIRLNAIAPGPFPTEGAWTRLVPEKIYEKAFLKKIPMKRYGEQEELANLAIFMMSDLCTYMTGECVIVDGGERLQSGQFNFIDSLASRKKLKKIFQAMKPKK
jgi:NAD(P)-dependent dehydrogenase (short-subunit alcohol dehydrogenase family)